MSGEDNRFFQASLEQYLKQVRVVWKTKYMLFNSLAPGKCGNGLKNAIFKTMHTMDY